MEMIEELKRWDTSPNTVYWPGLDADIADYVNHCKTCTQQKAKQAVQPMLPRDMPDFPWQELAADFFTHNHKEYLLIANTFSKYPFVYQTSSKTAKSITKKLQNLISQYGPPKWFFSDNGLPFSSKAFQKFLASQYIDHIISSPLYPKSNGFIKRQIKTIKTALATANSSGKSYDDLLLSLRSMPIGPYLPSPREILHNRTQDWPGQPPHPTDFEEVRNYFIAQKSTQKRHYNKRHNVRDLPELYPGQAVLFLSPGDTNIYVEGTITGPSTTPHSYTIEAQGITYCHNREHIQPINIDNPTIPRPSAHQENSIPGPSTQQSPISSPSSNNSHQNIPAKPSKPSCIPTPKCPASSSHSPATKHQVNNCHKPISHIPTSKNKLISRLSAYLSKPASPNKCYTSLTRPSNSVYSNSTIARISTTTVNNNPVISRPSYSPGEVLNILAQLISINGYTETKNTPNAETSPESSPNSPAPTVSSESSQLSEYTSESQKSTSSSPDDTETDTDSTSDDMQSITSQTSTASDRTLRPRIPINYNETLLQRLHGRPQIKTLNNLSIPLPDSSDEDTEDTDELTKKIHAKTQIPWANELTHLHCNGQLVCIKHHCNHEICM